MALNSYSALKTAIGDWLARSDLTSVIDDFIDLAEADINRELRVSSMISSLSSAISSGVLAVPTGFLEFVDVYIDGTPVQHLEPVTADRLIHDYPTRSSTSKPKYIAKEGSNFIFGPYPDQGYTVKGSYYAKLTPLGDGTGGTATTNYLTTDAPDMILAGALMYANEYIMDEERAAYWSRKFEAAIYAANERDKKERLSRRQALRMVPS